MSNNSNDAPPSQAEATSATIRDLTAAERSSLLQAEQSNLPVCYCFGRESIILPALSRIARHDSADRL